VRWPEAGAAPHFVRHGPHGPGLQRHQQQHRRQTGEVRPCGGRCAGPLPPARRQCRLRCAGAHGARLRAALPADRRPGQLWQPRRRRRCCHALHRSAPGQNHRLAAGRDRRRHGGLHRQLRRIHRGAQAVAGPTSVQPAQRRQRHCRGPGHRNSQPQPARSGRRLRGAHQKPAAQRRRLADHPARARLPRWRANHQPGGRHCRRLPHRPWQPQGARALEN